MRDQPYTRKRVADDTQVAAAGARREGFPPGSVIFLDIEEGGRLPSTYFTYLKAWASELERLGFRAGVYCSGIPIDEGEGLTLITSDFIREKIKPTELVYWVYNDACPPSPGCSTPQDPPAPSKSGIAYAQVWQFVRSPRDKQTQVSWGVANAHPTRLASLTVLSRPHPSSFQQALAKEDGDQKHRSRHHRAFLEPETGKMLLADNARRLRDGLFGQGVPVAALEEHLSVLGNPAALEAALAWYRANKGLAGDFGSIKVPTLYNWGDNDATVGPDAAHGTGEFIGAAYAMEVLPGVGHFVMDQAPAEATALMLAHMRKHPV